MSEKKNIYLFLIYLTNAWGYFTLKKNDDCLIKISKK